MNESKMNRTGWTLLVGLTLLFSACSRPAPREAERPLVVLLGFDGAGWPTIDPLLAQGKLPFLKALRQRSAWADLQTILPTKSSVIWTSIATGKTMQKHGILDFTYLEANHLPVPFSNAERREPAIWQILDQNKRRSIVLNWFASYPPDKIDGIVVSDHFRRLVIRPPEKAAEMADSVTPEIEFYKLKGLVDRDYPAVLARTGLPDFLAEYRRDFPQSAPERTFTLLHYPTFALQDALVEDLTMHLARREKFDLLAAYFRLPDEVQHFVNRFVPEAENDRFFADIWEKKVTPQQLRQRTAWIAGRLEPVYRYMETVLKELMAEPKLKDATFIVCSDHGFSFYYGGYNHYNLPEGMTPPPGILLVAGPEVRPGKVQAKVYDIAPTVLYALGLPLDRRMDGRPLKEAFRFSRKGEFTTYKMPAPGTKKHNPQADQEGLDELKTLGYL
ncbi:MAG TPA: alkaline phosphatase family protein [Candidatus Aminicenantes bacterium]|nr:alkaline phosphatase family protein [Candidatus Aminicenantes bacterium]